jgi:hypothetical protein
MSEVSSDPFAALTRAHIFNGLDPAGIVCEPLTPLAITDIPPRPWAYGKFLMFGEAGAIGAVDGGGKGNMAVAIALTMITGRELLGERACRTGPVAIITYEDKELEWRRRIAAACIEGGLDYDSVIGSVYFIKRKRGRIAFAASGSRGDVTFPDGDAIIAHLKAIGAVMLIIDPFNHAHGLADGNNNALIAQVAEEISRVAEESGVAVLVLHHLRKGAKGDPDDFMGALSLRATFRAVRILTRMLPQQAEQLKIPVKHRWRYMRIAGSKENYAPPAEFTTWYELKSVDLGNGAGIYEDGDSVAITKVWCPQSAFDGVSTLQIAEIFERLRTPPGEGLRWSPDVRSDEWPGKIIAEIIQKDDGAAQNIINTWKDTNVFNTDKYKHPKKRQLRDYIELNEAKAAEILANVYLEPDTE